MSYYYCNINIATRTQKAAFFLKWITINNFRIVNSFASYKFCIEFTFPHCVNVTPISEVWDFALLLIITVGNQKLWLSGFLQFREFHTSVNLMFVDPWINIEFTQKNPTRCNSVSKFIIPYMYIYIYIYIWSSTCFGRHTAHHQEPKTALAASGFGYVEGRWSRFQWPRGLRRRSAAAHLLRSLVRIPPGACIFACCECRVLSCQVEVSATSWSLVQRSPTDCAASLCVI